MIVDLPGTYVRPFGTGMSSNSLRAGRAGAVAHAPRSRRASSGLRSLWIFMGASLAGVALNGQGNFPERAAQPWIEKPPSTGIAAPVTKSEAALARKTAMPL